METMLPINATEAMHALEEVGRADQNVTIDIASLWNPQTCPAALLPWLAYAVSVDQWEVTWTEAQKRAAITEAITIHRTKGTIGALRRAMALFGAAITITEWWQKTPAGDPHTFDVTIALGGDVPATQDVLDRIQAAIDRVKPVRSHYTLITSQQVVVNMESAVVVWPLTMLNAEVRLS
ncbi:phage tail protein I [Emcibacter sp.]|uniref:phage tail protein I n=1 Tax=Emcibacter sp. TaxID=1979954 RepID=UPI002AA70023|nr:phage tail protein I [Emcibacter sp.]